MTSVSTKNDSEKLNNEIDTAVANIETHLPSPTKEDLLDIIKLNRKKLTKPIINKLIKNLKKIADQPMPTDNLKFLSDEIERNLNIIIKNLNELAETHGIGKKYTWDQYPVKLFEKNVTDRAHYFTDNNSSRSHDQYLSKYWKEIGKLSSDEMSRLKQHLHLSHNYMDSNPKDFIKKMNPNSIINRIKSAKSTSK